jgi:hypothetical protein
LRWPHEPWPFFWPGALSSKRWYLCHIYIYTVYIIIYVLPSCAVLQFQNVTTNFLIFLPCEFLWYRLFSSHFIVVLHIKFWCSVTNSLGQGVDRGARSKSRAKAHLRARIGSIWWPSGHLNF